MRKSDIYLRLGLIAVVDFLILTSPGALLSWLLHWWAQRIMQAQIDTPGFNAIFFCLGATTTALCWQPWNKYWVQGLTEGPRKRLIKRLRDDKE